MKKLFEKCTPSDKVFLIGFTALTVATFDVSLRWFAVTALGYGFLAWKFFGKRGLK